MLQKVAKLLVNQTTQLCGDFSSWMANYIEISESFNLTKALVVV